MDAFLSGGFQSLSALEFVITDRNTNLDFPLATLNSLRYLFVNGMQPHHVESLLPFMKLNGPNLLGLRFWTRQSFPELALLLEHTTSLLGLSIDDMDLVELCPTGRPICPSLTHLGLSGFPDIERITDGLDVILTQRLFPNLHTVQILYPDIPESIEAEWAQPIAVATKHGIRLEDYQRMLLVDKELDAPASQD